LFVKGQTLNAQNFIPNVLQNISGREGEEMGNAALHPADPCS